MELRNTIQYNAIDCFKFIFAILICAMHAGALKSFGETWEALLRLFAGYGVPFFCISSAFFLYRKGNTFDNIKHFSKRILFLYIIWTILNLPDIVHRMYPFLYDASWLERVWILFSRFFLFKSTFVGSWYLKASLFAVWFIYFIKNQKVAWIVALALHLFCVLAWKSGDVLSQNKYLSLYVEFFGHPYNSIFTLIPFFLIGKYIIESKMLERLRRNSMIVLFGVGMIFLLPEYFFYENCGLMWVTNTHFIGRVLASAALFVLVLRTPIGISDMSAKYLRKGSIIFFCSNYQIVTIIRFLLGKESNSLVIFLISVILCVCLQIVIIFLSNKPKFNWLKYAM